jgi:hypothetical protein
MDLGVSKTMIYGTDWGAYLNSIKGPAIPFKNLHDVGLLDFFVTKGCQEAEYYSSIKNIRWARDAGCKCVGSYYWHFPTWTPDYQVEVYGAAIEAEKPDFIALDMEDSYGCSDWQVTTNAEAVCEGLSKRFPDLKLYIYTSADYINGHCPTFNRSINKYGRWVACWPGLVQTGMARYLSFDEIKQYPLSDWRAKLPNGWTGWDIWQHNNWAIPEGYGWPFDHQYDWNASNLTIEQIMGKQEDITMAGINLTSKRMDERAWIFEYHADAKITGGIPSLGVDAVILPMVGMPWDGSHQKLVVETTFQGRFNESGGVAVLGKVVLDAGFVTTEQHTQPELDRHDAWNNLVIPKIIDAWHVGAWTRETLKLSDFLPIKALIFEMTSETDHQNPNKPIVEFWQTYFFKYVVDKLRVLMAMGAVPTVPIILKTNPAWLQKHLGETTLQDGRASWLYLMLTDTSQLASTNIFPDLYTIFQYPMAMDDYKYSYVPDHYFDRVLAWNFTAGKQRMSFITGNNLADLSLAFTDAAGLATFLGSTPVIPPPILPPVDPNKLTLEEAKAALRDARAIIDAALAKA